MIAFPPSPTLSDCDSLIDIDDLDAFLDAQGQISHFPTPPLPGKDDTLVHETEVEHSDDEDELDCRPAVSRFMASNQLTSTDHYIAELFTREASIGVAFNDIDIRMIQRILVRAQLPPEVLALAFNIVCGLDCQSLPVGSFYSAPNDLIVVSALSLAVSYTNDHPPTVKHWARYVCDGSWTSIRVDKTTLQVFAALGWCLHRYSAPNAIQRSLATLASPSPINEPAVRIRDSWVAEICVGFTVPEQVKLAIEGTSTCWVNGQITPDGTPPSTGFVVDEDRFLPLL